MPKLTEVILNLTLPPNIFTKDFFSLCLIHEAFIVRSTIIALLLNSTKKLSALISHHVETSKLKETLNEALLGRLPDIATLLQCWKLTCNNQCTDKGDEIESYDTLSSIVEVLSAYQNVSPHSFTSENVDLSSLMVSINQGKDHFAKNDWLKLYLSVLQLLGHGRFYHMLISSASLKLLIETMSSDINLLKNMSSSLLKSIIERSTLFGDSDSLDVWLSSIENSKADVRDFFVEAVMDAASSASKEAEADISDRDLFLRILNDEPLVVPANHDNDSVDPLVKSALKLMKQKNCGDETLSSYLNSVLVSLIHFNNEPSTLCSYMKENLSAISSDLKSYILIWIKGLAHAQSGSPKKKPKPKKSLPMQQKLQKVILAPNESFLPLAAEIDGNISTRDFLEIIHQILLYISLFMQADDPRIGELCSVLDSVIMSYKSPTKNQLHLVILQNENIFVHFLDKSEPIDELNAVVLHIFRDFNVTVEIIARYAKKAEEYITFNLSHLKHCPSFGDVSSVFIPMFDSEACLRIVGSSKMSNLMAVAPSILVKLIDKCIQLISDYQMPLLPSTFVSTFGSHVSKLSEPDFGELGPVLLTLIQAMPMYAVVIDKGVYFDVCRELLSN